MAFILVIFRSNNKNGFSIELPLKNHESTPVNKATRYGDAKQLKRGGSYWGKHTILKIVILLGTDRHTSHSYGNGIIVGISFFHVLPHQNFPPSGTRSFWSVSEMTLVFLTRPCTADAVAPIFPVEGKRRPTSSEKPRIAG